MYPNRFPFQSIFALLLVGILSAACAVPTPILVPATPLPATNTPIPAPASLTPTSIPPSPTVPATATNTNPAPTQPVVTTNPAGAPTTAPGPGSSPDYLDDRSTATGLIQSYFNAINLKQYLRAYSYWESGSKVGSFDKFQQGYQNTASAQITLGTISADAGAGQLHYTVPVAIIAQTTDGKTQTFSACYTLHIANPGIQAAVPFIPLGISTGAAKTAANGTKPADILAHACDGVPQGMPVAPAPVTNTKDITSANYLDDRSDPVEVLSSLFNAVNRKEYARAYYYWENAGSSKNVPSFDQFQKGYATTDSVQLTTGPVSSDAGAGQIYYRVPAVLIAKLTSGATQTFSACYTLHLSRPEIQATPPFQPLAVQSATAKQVNNGSDATALLKQACPSQ